MSAFDVGAKRSMIRTAEIHPDLPSPTASFAAPFARRWVSLLLGLAQLGCAARMPAPPPPSPIPPDLAPIHPGRPLRVGIAIEAAEVEIRAGVPAELERAGGQVVGRFRQLRLTPGEGGTIAVEPAAADRRLLPDTVRIRPPAGHALALGSTPYRGAIEVYGDGHGTLTAVNLVDLEEYLLGVVPLEIGEPGPASFEAVMAQAVAARTYTVSHLGRWPDQGFDLYGDVRDQAYGGIKAERPGALRAVTATAGLVATHRDKLIGAYYSAACGGTTAAVEETWAFPPEEYLRARRDRRGGADFCQKSRHYRWEERWSAADFMQLIARYLSAEFGGPAPEGRLEDARVSERNSSGRVRKLVVRAGGREYVMRGDRVRWVLRREGGAILRSSAFNLEVVRRAGEAVEVVARGAGNGHGVGLCQAGALEMAAQGFNYAEILGHYYPRIRLVRLRGPGMAGRSLSE
jgi:stage II sporulation protein D